MSGGVRAAVFLESAVRVFTPTDAQFGRFRSKLAAVGAGEAVLCRDLESFLAALPTATHALTWTFRQEWFACAPKLRQIATPAAGKDYFHVTPPPGVVLRYGSFHGAIIGETAAGAVLALAHGLLQGASLMNCGSRGAELWPRPFFDSGRTRRLAGSTVLVLGFGAIGRAAGKALKTFGVRILGLSRSRHPAPDWFGPGDEVLVASDLDAALSRADYVLCFLPSGPETDRLLDARHIGLMRPGSHLLNFGRGNLIDEAALARALDSGAIAGAVLDVFSVEPLPADSPLRRARNAFLYPHCSAFSPDYIDLFFDEWLAALTAASPVI